MRRRRGQAFGRRGRRLLRSNPDPDDLHLLH